MRKLYNHWATGLIVVAAVIGLIFGGVYALAQNTPALAFASESEDDENEYGFFDGEDDEGEEREDEDNERGESEDDDDFEGGEGFRSIFGTVGIIGLAVVGIAVVFPWLRSRFTSGGTAPPTE